MRNELNAVLKDFLQSRLKEIKEEKDFTQTDMANILQMAQRTFAAVTRGEHSLGGLSMALYMVFMVDNSNHEIENLRKSFLQVLGKDWEERNLKKN